MSPQPDIPESVRRVTLPGGRTIEIVYFTDAAPPANLHVCPACSSELVHPTDWEEAEQGGWALSLRCPNCEHTERGIYRSEDVELFDEQLDMAVRSLTSDLLQLEHVNMQDEVDRFVAALQDDQIVPFDF